MSCKHLGMFAKVKPSADGCEQCLKTADEWVHLRICRVCGHVGCCDESKNQHATKHFQASQHPVMEDYFPGDGWGWCYVDDVMIELGDDVTPHPDGWEW